ncbi:hypothetical protein BKH46_07070 [Helicobacter sp. 12S02634-8]|nr:hypothetical protein BKH46_07070 [Helicobacter sp. 12S02634-8]
MADVANAPKSPTPTTQPQNTPAPKVPKDTPKDTPQPPKTDKLLQETSKPKKVIFIQEEFYEPKNDEISLEKTDKGLFLIFHSKQLQDFAKGGIYKTKQQVQTFALEDSFTQITNIDGKIYEYKYAQKSIDRYSAIAPYQKYALKEISAAKYQIPLKKIPQIFDIKECKIVIKKQLTGTLNQKKEVIINLDTKRELRNKSYFDLFLECPK